MVSHIQNDTFKSHSICDGNPKVWLESILLEFNMLLSVLFGDVFDVFWVMDMCNNILDELLQTIIDNDTSLLAQVHDVLLIVFAFLEDSLDNLVSKLGVWIVETL